VVVTVLEHYKAKPEFLPATLQLLSVYVRPGELSAYFDASQWELTGRTFHPNQLQARDVERWGYCLRRLPSWVRAGKWYGSASQTENRDG
jgi:hypothetical protein